MATMHASSLRERKKQRTRESLIDAALNLFTEQGFAATTLDGLCDAVDVSKRTFFRAFTGKEAVALAPIEDLWREFLVQLPGVEPAGRPVLNLLEDALLAALDAMPGDEWAHRARSSTLLAAKTPSMRAHCLYFCETTTQDAVRILHQELDLQLEVETQAHGGPDLRLSLALDLFVAAFHHGLNAWAVESGTATHASLVVQTRRALAAVPGSITLVAERKS
jgi:AcrR family transcriptional regulator